MTAAVHRVLKDDDPAMAPLLAAGWRVAHRSWAARLSTPDREALAAAVRRAEASGYRVDELGPSDAAAVVGLAVATRADFPGGPATAPAECTPDSLAADRVAGARWFGASRDGVLVAVTAIRAGDDRAETDHTRVATAHRRRGLAEAVKAASVLALMEDGVTVFGTGGAAENAASLAMNARLGYVVTERWRTLLPPA